MRNVLVTVCLIGALAIGFTLTPPAHADPAPPPCVKPDGAPCAPAGPGCVRPTNGLPCSSSLPDVNAAIRQELLQILGGSPLPNR
jgi:hypothetical protein